MNIIDQLRRDEGVRKFPYTDTVGKLTIGVGRNLDDVGLRDHEINFLLEQDVAECHLRLTQDYDFFPQLSEPRQGVLLNMCFNLGAAGLAKFKKFLAAMREGNWETAANEMLDSLWARQVGDRATRLAKQVTTGDWQ